MTNERKGTGRHGHKDSQEPWPHHEGSEQRQTQSRSGPQNETSGSQSDRGDARQSQGSGLSRRNESGESQEDLKAREYRDKEGNVHHHTKTYMEQHGKEENEP